MLTEQDFVPEIARPNASRVVTAAPSCQPYEQKVPDLFAVLESDFFKPLSNPYRRLYWRLLAMFFRYKYEGGPDELLRSVALEIAEEVLLSSDEWVTNRSGLVESLSSISDGTAPLVDEARDTARRLLAYLSSSGWIFYEFYRDLGEVVNFRPSAARLMGKLLQVARQEEPVLQSFANVLDMLMSSGSATPGSTVHQIRRLTVEYSRELRILRENIRDSTNRLIEEGETPADVLVATFDRYGQQVGRNYDLIKTRDNVYGWRGRSIRQLSNLAAQDGLIEDAAAWYAQQFGLSAAEAEDRVFNDLSIVRDHIDAMPKVVSDLDERNQRFSSAASRRVAYLTRHDAATEGQLQFLIDGLAAAAIPALELPVFKAEFLYGDVLATPRLKRVPPRNEPLRDAPSLTREEAAEHARSAMRSRFSPVEVERRIRQLLAGRRWVDSQAIALESEDDFVFHISLQMYGRNMPREVAYRFEGIECGLAHCPGFTCPVCRDRRGGYNIPRGHVVLEEG